MSATVVAAMSGVPFDMLVAATTGSGTVVACPASFRNHNFIVAGTGTISAGTVTIETSNDPNYAGTWAPLIPVAGTTASPNPTATIVSGAEVLINYAGILNFVRARVSTTVTGAGGSVTVTYEGAKSY